MTKTVTDNQCDGLLVKLGLDIETHHREAIRQWLAWLDAHEPAVVHPLDADMHEPGNCRSCGRALP